MKWTEIQIDNLNEQEREILIALLDANGYEAFEEKDYSLKAFINSDKFDKNDLDAIARQNGFKYVRTDLPDRNWNELWESNFPPVVIDDFVLVRADFHPPQTGVAHEIVITPKMSFGTGHHATTTLMIGQMRKIDFTGKLVLDFGTGTGILAIFAEKLGAAQIIAIDNDPWCIESANENILKNHCSKVEVHHSDTPAIFGSYGIILANINRNVLIDNMGLLSGRLEAGGVLLISGFLETDINALENVAFKYGLKPGDRSEKQGWCSLMFVR